MKIIIIAPSHSSFVSKFLPLHDIKLLPEGYFGAPFIGTLIGQLLLEGHEVISITTTLSTDNNTEIKEFCYKKFKWIVVPARQHIFKFNGLRLGKMLDFFSYERRLIKEAVIRENADFVHAHWSYEFAGSLRGITVPHLITIHDNPYQVLKYTKNLYRFGRLLMSEWVLNKVHFSSTVSPYMLKYAKAKTKKVSVIPNPVVISETNDSIKLLIEARIKVINQPKIAMIMNGWDLRKNGVSGIKAFKAIQAILPDASLHLFGQGAEKGGSANRLADEIKVKGVVFHGITEHKELLMHLETVHILIHPSFEESFGVAIIEGMSYGIPVIGGSESGAVPWVIDDKRLLVDLTHFINISDRAIKLLQDTNLYYKLSERCFDNVVKRFSVTAIVKQYESYYKDIIKSWV